MFDSSTCTVPHRLVLSLGLGLGLVSQASRVLFFLFLVKGGERKKTSGDFSQVSVSRWNAIT